jgi:fibronectin-binding autotransporter adhesin
MPTIGRALMALALAGSSAGIVIGTMIASAPPAAAAGCDTWTNSSGGSWDDGSNWSDSAPPSGTTNACITAPGTYTVTISNETISAGALTVGAPGSSPTLSIGDSSAGEPDVTFAKVTNLGTIESGFGGSLTVTGAFSNTSTGLLQVPSTGFGGTTLDIATLDNQGTLEVDATSSYVLPTSSSLLLNDSTGTINVSSGTSLTVSSPVGQTGTVTQDGVLNDLGQFIASESVTVEGGSICNNPLQVGVDGQSDTTDGLNFASVVAKGPSCGTGVPTDNVSVANIQGSLSGSIPSSYTVSIGDGGPSTAQIAIPSAMTVRGTLNVGYEGSLTSAAAIKNKGTIDAFSSAFPGETFTLPKLTNNGAFDIDTPSTYVLPMSSSQLVNASTGTVSVASGASLSISSPSGQNGTVTQDGVIDNSGTVSIQNPLTVNGGTICGNAVQIGVDGQTGGSLAFGTTVTSGPACGGETPSDQLSIANITGTLSGTVPKAYLVVIGDGGPGFANVSANTSKNLGTIEAGFGATVSFFNNLKNKGTILVPPSGFTTTIDLGGTLTNIKNLVLDGATQITASELNNRTSSTVSIGGDAVSLNGPISNAGVLAIAAGGSLSTSSTYAQSSTAVYEPQLASTTSYGVINTADISLLSGTVAAQDADGFTPPSGSTYVVLTSAGLDNTTFENVQGAFTAQYTTSDTDVQLTAN